MTTMQNYDPKAIIITFGPILITGFADGEFLSVERNEETFSLQVGSDGGAARSRTNNKSGRATMKLLQTSPVNDLLEAARALDEAGLPGGVLPFLVKDLFGATLVTAMQAWVVKPPALGFDREAGEREWIIESHDINLKAGGSVL